MLFFVHLMAVWAAAHMDAELLRLMQRHGLRVEWHLHPGRHGGMALG